MFGANPLQERERAKSYCRSQLGMRPSWLDHSPDRVDSDSGVLIGKIDSKEKANMMDYTTGDHPVNAYD